MKCQFCQINQSTVHVSEIENWVAFGSVENKVVTKHLCEMCAQQQDLPFTQAGSKASTKLWKLMNLTAKVEVKTTVLSCVRCGMTQMDLRKKGRVGCPHCYEVFQADLDNMLERIHGATEHTGRVPGIESSSELDRRERIGELKNRLENAIREEQFEVAADLRDQLADLEGPEG